MQQSVRRRDPPFSGNSYSVSNSSVRESNNYNRNRPDRNGNTYITENQRTQQNNRNEGRDRQRDRYQSYRTRDSRSRTGYERQQTRRFNNVQYGNIQDQNGRESDDYRLSNQAQEQSYTQNQTGISQVIQGNSRTPTSSARDVGDAPRNSGYRN